MYGLKPSDIEALAPLRDAVITQICVGPTDIQFNFSPQGNISVWGRCELLNSAGETIEIWEGSTLPGIFRFPEVLMSPVVDVLIDTSKSFVMKFANEMSIRIVDNSEQYESFSVGKLIV